MLIAAGLAAGACAWARLRGSVGVSWRYGMANIARRGRDSVIQIVAFGLGLMVLLLLAVVRNDLMQEWRASLPDECAEPFHDQHPPRPDRGDPRVLRAAAPMTPPELVPMIRARLTQINGTPVAQLQIASERGRDFLEREANLTWAQTHAGGQQARRRASGGARAMAAGRASRWRSSWRSRSA